MPMLTIVFDTPTFDHSFVADLNDRDEVAGLVAIQRDVARRAGPPVAGGVMSKAMSPSPSPRERTAPGSTCPSVTLAASTPSAWTFATARPR